MGPDLRRARELALNCPGYMPTRDQWEEAQRLLLTMARELTALRAAVVIHPEGDPDKQELHLTVETQDK